MARILIVDDQDNARCMLSDMLQAEGYAVDQAEGGESACIMVGETSYDLVITDLRMGDVGGLDVLQRTREASPLTEVIVMTAFGTVEDAVEAMRLGARDFVQKPFVEDELLIKVARAARTRQIAGERRAIAADFRERYNFGNIIGQSAEIRDILGRIVRIAPTDATVLITGESGTGKELVARAIHANSLRAERPFVSINCAALPETLLESELFGHMRGAFTGAVQTRKGLFEEANGGTFFFDEIADTPPSLQAKLLRAIQEGEIRRLGDNSSINVDARIIAATNQNLRVLIEEKRFREDLYYRLNVARFELPPLRDRKEDIAPIVDSFLEKYGKKMSRQASLGPGILDYLLGYDFPGNIRELENLIEQGVALAQDGQIHLSDIVPNSNGNGNALHLGRKSLADIVREVERDAIVRALRQVEGSKERAATLLGLSPTTLWRKMKRLQLEWP
ncbi:MAG: sigma-54-dependent Fis family transcriptional regulator [Deltaproteobacteria bacterium]|nr:sigma-54-dependent Fis family transcriptional regulator [Deltaproteobacteria bacterium]MBW1873843.1 sigma-54-dependent Fis family transcriptional regulator [Deltaproteobacteria bacterium]MBW2209723.1 sigma-54-dependent Fis family transcriptional regulator [Deltaproteobacteria bacterium]MBW2213701.1 sigma-54-dependent Fis family transcriptional regulator [Deltaproteobacteria bacterium]MBW2378053.1 sigma-54-dependent Fis family transcriptional regulator [Deltaproteobacteria bacterium]